MAEDRFDVKDGQLAPSEPISRRAFGQSLGLAAVAGTLQGSAGDASAAQVPATQNGRQRTR